MDIDLLSNMVKDLILDNEKVVLPGLGCFVAEVVPATFSDRGYTINPPYRRLYFRSRPDEGHLLADLYAKSNKVDVEMADRILRDFLKELRSVLFTRKTVIFPGLGRLRATKENNIFFVADEDLDIYPIGFTLETISMKSHQEREERMVSALGQLKDMMAGIVPEEEEEAPAEKAPAAAPAVEVKTVYEQPVAEPEAEFEEVPEVEEVNFEVLPEETVPAETAGEEVVEEEVPSEIVEEKADETPSEVGVSAEVATAAEAESPAEADEEDGKQEGKEEVKVEEESEEEVKEDVAEEVKEEEKVKEEEEEMVEEEKEEKDVEKVDVAAEQQATDPAEPANGEIKLEKENSKPHQGRKKALIAVAIILGIAAVLIGTFFLVNWLAPDFMESLLYTEEEIEILHYGK